MPPSIVKAKQQLKTIGLMIVVVFCFVMQTPVGAESAAAISQGFKTAETNIATGALVSLETGSQSTVQLGNTDRTGQLVGVIGDKPLVELSNNDKEVQVVIGGTSQALVSDINGEVKTGDKVTASPINGVGMKATSSAVVIGTAQSNFSDVSSTTKTIRDKNNVPQNVKIGLLPVQINVNYYVAEDQTSFLPPFLQALANAVAGREVSPVRVLISMVVLTFGFISIAVLLYSSIRSSIISIGRNPLSEGAVRKSLFEVGATAFGILLVMLVTIYLVLTT